jgi:hypothetical protein
VRAERLIARRDRQCSQRVVGVTHRRQRVAGLLVWMFRITAATAIAVPSRTVFAQVSTIGNGVTATGLVANSAGAGTQDGTLFAAPGTSLPQNQVTTGVSVGMRPAKALTVSLGYDALLAPGHASAQAANLKVDYEF